MVAHPAEYPWSSYQHNALDKQIELLTAHPLYLALGNDVTSRKAAYQALFKATYTGLFPKANPGGAAKDLGARRQSL